MRHFFDGMNIKLSWIKLIEWKWWLKQIYEYHGFYFCDKTKVMSWCKNNSDLFQFVTIDLFNVALRIIDECDNVSVLNVRVGKHFLLTSSIFFLCLEHCKNWISWCNMHYELWIVHNKYNLIFYSMHQILYSTEHSSLSFETLWYYILSNINYFLWYQTSKLYG